MKMLLDNLEKEGNEMSNSSLVTVTKLSPNHSGKRTHTIDRITPHCVVGQFTASAIGDCFASKSRKASCNYGIGTEGGVCLVVDESNRSWCSSSNANDQRAVTIECASDKTSPYAFNNTVYNKLIELCVDICKRNGKKRLLWFNDKTKSLNYSPAADEMVLTVHRWFANKSCPGDWLMARMDDLADRVTAQLSGNATTSSTSSVKKDTTTTTSSTTAAYSVGDVIQLVDNATYYNGKPISTAILKSTLYYRGKNKNGIIFSTLKSGAITGVVKESMIKTTTTQAAAAEYIVQVTATSLNVRKGPGVSYKVTGSVKKNSKYTIVETKDGWGRLKSNLGWINLSYTKRV